MGGISPSGFAGAGANEQIGGILQSIAGNGNLTNQLLGQIVEALQNTGTIAATGSVTSSSATAGIGYATGAGGTVGQSTSKSTSVTLNKVCGQILTDAASLNSNTTVSFSFVNSTIETADNIIVTHSYGGTSAAYLVWPTTITAGACQINIRNITGGALAEALGLTFTVLKGATA